ncbi:MAG: GAF domain-containing protein, partial [Myxococcales bacterium]|nr:GAF domain-containing protein [Myxococcales bacterium]
REPAELLNEFTHLDGCKEWFRLRFVPVNEGVLILSTDVTATNAAQEALRRSARVAGMARACRTLIAAHDDEATLLTALCQRVAERGGYHLAWVGMAEAGPERRIRLSARHGVGAELLDGLDLTWGERDSGLGPAGRAIRDGQVVVARFVDEQPGHEHWRRRAVELGFRSSVALPLEIAGRTAGVLCIYAAELDAFEGAEQLLLEDLALDLGDGLTALRSRRAGAGPGALEDRAAREALEDYGYPNRPLDPTRTAVIVGNAMGGDRHYQTALRIYAPEYLDELARSVTFAQLPEAQREASAKELLTGIRGRLPEVNEDSMPGELANIIAGRIAAIFDFHGPNFVTDAACASAMAAMAAAVEGLEEGYYDTVVAGGVTSTRTGSCSSRWARATMSSGMVALNRSDCRFFGRASMILRTSRMKPMSSMRSASSRTKISTRERSACPWPMRSRRRPGVATRISTPRRSACTCGFWPTPPKITVCRSFSPAP